MTSFLVTEASRFFLYLSRISELENCHCTKLLLKRSQATIEFIERTSHLSFSKFEISSVGVIIVYNSLIGFPLRAAELNLLKFLTEKEKEGKLNLVTLR
jgi:hypothetical protein